METNDEELEKAMFASFLRMSLEERALILISAEKAERGEMSPDGQVTITAAEFSAKLAELRS